MEGNKKAAVFCVLKSGSQFLLLKRAKEPNIGKYVPVGGKIDPFETPRQAMIREIQEEAGINDSKVNFCGLLTETSPINYNWISYIYTAEVPFFNPPICDEGILHWVHRDDLKTLNTPPTDWFIYQYIDQNKPFCFSAIYNEELLLLSMTDELEETIVL